MPLASTMLCIELPSAATMAIATTNSGKRHQHVGRAADDAVDEAAEEGRGPADARPDHERQQHRRECDGEVEPRGDQDPAEHVAPDLIGAEDVLPVRGLQHAVKIDRVGIVGHDPRGDGRNHDQQRQ